MTERQLIQEILNTEDVEYEFKNVDKDTSRYDINVFLQKEDRRPLPTISAELQHYFNDAGFNYTENTGDNDDLAFIVKK